MHFIYVELHKPDDIRTSYVIFVLLYNKRSDNNLRVKIIYIFIMAIIRFAVKASIVGGTVYCSYTEGLWSNSEETAKLYEKIYVNVAPYVKENIPSEVTQRYAQLPSVTTISTCIKKSWNKGVMTSVEFISDLPTYTTNGATGLYAIMEKFYKENS